MKKIIGSGIGLLALALSAATVFAATNPKEFSEEMKRELGNPACSDGVLVVDVSHGVTNDIDSGFGGYWAYDNYTRDLKAYDHGDGLYCVVAKYRGTFDAVQGRTSPGTGYILDGNEDGMFKGGYWGKLRGQLKEVPDYPTSGNIGSFDYGCDIAVGPSSCSYWSWLGAYFEPGYSFNYGWWGWLYLSPNHGWWINASTGSVGDIN